MFPEPRNQCVAMSAAVLAGNKLLQVQDWTKTIIDETMRDGQEYYNTCMIHMEEYDKIDGCPASMYRNITISNRLLYVLPELGVYGDYKMTVSNSFVIQF